MAIAIRGTTPATQTHVSDSTPLSIILTGSRQPQSGDVLVIVHGNNFYTISQMVSPTVGGSTTGVTAVTNGTADNGTDSAHAKAWYYIVTSTGDATVALDEPGLGDEDILLAIYVLSGVDTGTPIDIAGNAIATGSTTHICPSVTATATDDFLICHTNIGGGASVASYTPPGGMSEQYDISTTFGGFTGATEQLSASGATGTRTFTPSTGNVNNCELTVAVKTSSGAAAADSPSYSPVRLPGLIGPDGKVFTPNKRFDNNGAAAVATSAPAGSADGTGTALQPTAALGASAGVAAATGSAPQPSATLRVGAGVAAATGTALQPTIAIKVNAGIAQADGAALQPTVATSGSTNAPAGLAAVTGTAFAPTIAVRPSAGVAAATGAANQPAAALGVRAGVAAGTGSALQATVTTGTSTNAPAGLAAATGTANQPIVAIRVNAGLAAATGTAFSVSLVQVVTPDFRIFAVPADPRTLAVEGNRIFAVPSDPRTFTVPVP